MRADAEASVFEALAALQQAVNRIAAGDPLSDRLALSTALPVLRRASLALPNESERRKARSAYRMVAAALGVEHD